jgi:hypothetical protein
MRGAVQIEQLPVKKLCADPRNSRTHSDAQVVKLMSSLKEFGFTNPILIDKDNKIIAGHGRLMAAKKLGFIKVPCIRLEYLTDEQRRAYAIADNRLAEDAGWDLELLKSEIVDLKSLGFDVDLTGFDDAGMDATFEQMGQNPKNQGDKKPATDIHELSDQADFPEVGMYDFPVIRPDMILEPLPEQLSIWCGADMSAELPPPYFYNYASDSTRGLDFEQTVLGFYVDDYRFERFYDSTGVTVAGVVAKNYLGAVMPNFSTYFNWSKAIRLFSIYKSRWVGRYMQEAGIKIIPDLTCAPQDIECLCDGLEGIRTFAVQAHQKYDAAGQMQKEAVIDFMMEQLKPETLLLYAPENRLKMFPGLTRARVVRVEPRMSFKTQHKKAQH